MTFYRGILRFVVVYSGQAVVMLVKYRVNAERMLIFFVIEAAHKNSCRTSEESY